MAERYSATTRFLLLAANDQAAAVGHVWLGTEHVMLAELALEEMAGDGPLLRAGIPLTRAREMVAAQLATCDRSEADALRALGIEPTLFELARRLQEFAVTPTSHPALPPHSLPLTARMRRVLDRAGAGNLRGTVDPVDVWRALLDDGTGVGLLVLEGLAVRVDDLVANEFGHFGCLVMPPGTDSARRNQR